MIHGISGQHRITTKQDCSTAAAGGMLRHVASIVEIEKLALILSDEDEGVAEALRRDADLDANPDQAISLESLDDQVKSRRG